ncbi:MAG: hypothetical protein ABSB69_14890 [Solirubrobacteraceae bacterium]
MAALCAVALCSCANTVQDQPIPHNLLEGLIEAPFPVYWLGGSFDGMAVSEATHDPSGSYSVQYGDCLVGGQGTCVPPLRVVTSPDNSFLPGGTTPSSRARIRGVDALLAQAGTTIVVPTGVVVVDIYATSARTAAAAARTVVPINALGAPEAPLPAALPNTGFGEMPLPSQVPPPLHPLG